MTSFLLCLFACGVPVQGQPAQEQDFVAPLVKLGSRVKLGSGSRPSSSDETQKKPPIREEWRRALGNQNAQVRPNEAAGSKE